MSEDLSLQLMDIVEELKTLNKKVSDEFLKIHNDLNDISDRIWKL